METILQADDRGGLHLPPAVLPNAEPRAAYHVLAEGGRVTIAKAGGAVEKPFWETASPEERLAALREWLSEAATPAGLSDYAVSRESMYD